MENNRTLWIVLGAAVVIAVVGWLFLSTTPVSTTDTNAPATTPQSNETAPAPQPAPAAPPAAPAQ